MYHVCTFGTTCVHLLCPGVHYILCIQYSWIERPTDFRCPARKFEQRRCPAVMYITHRSCIIIQYTVPHKFIYYLLHCIHVTRLWRPHSHEETIDHRPLHGQSYHLRLM